MAFACAEVTRAASACRGPFDIVYTSIGALCWLPDLGARARAIASVLAPGGVFYVRDAHPILTVRDQERTDGAMVLAHPYFGGGPVRYDDGTTYADPEVRLANATTDEWRHPVSEIVQSLLDASLTLTSFVEHRPIPWRALPHLVPGPGGFVPPTGAPSAPLTLSLTATAPAVRSGR